MDVNNDMVKKFIANTFGSCFLNIKSDMVDYVTKFSKEHYNQPMTTKVKNWDEYFFGVAKAVSLNSKCLSRQIGGVLVQDKSIIGTGYNGPPRGLPDCGIRHKLDIDLWAKYKAVDPFFDQTVTTTKCPRQLLGYGSGEGLEWCISGHSERNCLINSARNGIATKGSTMYLTCNIPCSPCLVELINAGVTEVVVTSFDFYDASSKFLIDQSGIKIRMYLF